jgi:N6-L-threonylcarbamoyladenine synthase
MCLFFLILRDFLQNYTFLETKAIILGIESSCDDTSIAIVENRKLLSNIVANQEIHKKYGGVIPELASRAHQINIVPVLQEAIQRANLSLNEINAIAFTSGPGLLGSLLVGTSFAKGLAIALNIPLIEVNHLHGHILSHFIIETESDVFPDFPHICLLISGGHTQLLLVNSPYEIQLLGSTIDDACGEAFDKAAKILGFEYPGGPIIDKLAKQGNPKKFTFPKPKVEKLNFSFSGIKTSLLYFIRDNIKNNPDFVKENIYDICASYQNTITEILIEKTLLAIKQTNIKMLTLSGGVSANSYIRNEFEKLTKKGIKVFLPKIKFTTDNAAMIAIAGYYKYLKQDFAPLNTSPYAKFKV